MTREKIEQLIAEYLEGTISADRRALFEQLIRDRAIDPDKFLELRQFHIELEKLSVPEPSQRVSERFYTMLEKEKQVNHHQKSAGFYSFIDRLYRTQILNYRTAAVVLIALLTGLFVGSRISSNDQSRIENLSNEIQQMRQVMMLSMLDDPSAVERIQAVNIGSQLTTADDKIIDALLTTLDTDTNINVRQQSIDVLLQWGDIPKVRMGLLNAIDRQESPLVLIALADAMTFLNEQRSADIFQRLLEENEYDPSVEQKLLNSIAELR